MVLDHSRLGLVTNFWTTNHRSGRIFCVRQVYFTKWCQQIWGWVNQPFIPFIHHIWGEKVLWGAVFIIQTSERCSISQFFKTNCAQSIFRTINRGLLAKPFKTFPKLPIRSTGSHFWQAPNFQSELWWRVLININRVMLQQNKEFIMFIFFYLMVL